MEGLTEGRIVHFVGSENWTKHRAALVCNVTDQEKGICDLFVFAMPEDQSGGFFMHTETAYDANKSEGTWHWIEKA
jgi:hypothetical protein